MEKLNQKENYYEWKAMEAYLCGLKKADSS